MQPLRNDIFFAEVERFIAEGVDVVLRVKGHSMRPFIRSGRTQVKLSPCDASSLRKGDIVLFRHNGHHIMHRIICRQEDVLTLAGDGNRNMTEKCMLQDVVAKATAVITRRGKTIECNSALWRTVSALWIALPSSVRHIVLGGLWRIGVK